MRYQERFDDLEAALDEVHVRLRKRIEDPSTNGSAEALCRLQLAAHEWIANLVRHAHFGQRSPEVHVHIWKEEKQIRCTISDNSKGFDLRAQLVTQRKATQGDVTQAARALPDGGMGLLLLEASTDHAEYLALNEQANRLELVIDMGGYPDNGHAGDGAAPGSGEVFF